MRRSLRSMFLYAGLLLLPVLAAGCTASGKTVRSQEDEELRRLAGEMRKDPEAQEAVKVITDGLTGTNVSIKYCPFDGKRFSGTLEKCPEHDVPLKNLDE